MQNPIDLIRWMHNASKNRVSALAKLIFVARESGDAAAQRIIHHAADELVLATQVVISKLGINQPSDIILSGGIVTHQPGFVNLLREHLRPMGPNARIDLATYEPACGAVLLARLQSSSRTSLQNENAGNFF